MKPATGKKVSQRKKIQNTDELHQKRYSANSRERQRTQELNMAFNMLRRLIPSMPSDKMSKIHTLRIATEYIAFLDEMISDESAFDGNGFNLQTSFNIWRSGKVQQQLTAAASTTTPKPNQQPLQIVHALPQTQVPHLHQTHPHIPVPQQTVAPQQPGAVPAVNSLTDWNAAAAAATAAQLNDHLANHFFRALASQPAANPYAAYNRDAFFPRHNQFMMPPPGVAPVLPFQGMPASMYTDNTNKMQIAQPDMSRIQLPPYMQSMPTPSELASTVAAMNNSNRYGLANSVVDYHAQRMFSQNMWNPPFPTFDGNAYLEAQRVFNFPFPSHENRMVTPSTHGILNRFCSALLQKCISEADNYNKSHTIN